MKGLYIAEQGPLVVLLDEPGTGQLLFSRMEGKCSVFCRHPSNWDSEMSPWPAPGLNAERGSFAGGGEGFLASLLEALPDAVAALPSAPTGIALAGYSLAGLFALWAGTKTDAFSMLLSASGSLWYDGWNDYLSGHPCLAEKVYLSLGKKEPDAKNARMRTVGDCTARTEELLRSQGKDVTFHWNHGGHFTEPLNRLEEGVRWLIGAEK